MAQSQHEYNQEVVLDYIKRDIHEMKTSFARVEAKLEANYVSKQEFEPVRKIVYGLVGVILIAVVGALVTLVIQ